MKEFNEAVNWLEYHSRAFELYEKPLPTEEMSAWGHHLEKHFKYEPDVKNWDYAWKPFDATLNALKALKEHVVSCNSYRDGGSTEFILDDGIVIIFPFVIPPKGRVHYSKLVIVAYPDGVTKYI